jgi:hypothetical protein
MTLTWRISSYSGSSSTCVALARDETGDILLRNSNAPAAGTLRLDPAVLATWLDDLR